MDISWANFGHISKLKPWSAQKALTSWQFGNLALLSSQKEWDKKKDEEKKEEEKKEEEKKEEKMLP